MPIKLILILILVVLVAVLTGFNLSNVCTIWFFHTFTNIPVFAALLVSFILGVLVTLPFTIGKGKAKFKSSENEVSPKFKNSKFNKKDKFSKNAAKVLSQNDENNENAGKSSNLNSLNQSSQNKNSENELDVSDANYVPPKSNQENAN